MLVALVLVVLFVVVGCGETENHKLADPGDMVAKLK